MVRSKVEAIRVEEDKAIISEILCSGCGICVKKCPFKAISIVNLPDELEKDSVTLRDMKTGKQNLINIKDLPSKIT